MSAPTSPHPWTPDWAALWRFGACWAGRPAAGVILPGSERLNVMTRVMDHFITAHPSLPGELQTYAFLQSHAVRLALEATRQARHTSAQPDLWHDSQHRGTTPVIDLVELQRSETSHLWQALLVQMKPRALGLLRSEGVDNIDAEDLFAEAMAGMVKPRKDGTAVIADLLVYEQLPALFLSIVRRRLINHIRHRNAEKRAVQNTVSLDLDDDHFESITERSTFSSWAADAADPMHGMSLARLADECAHTLTDLQQRILRVLYIEESAAYMEVAASPWLTQALGLRPSASDATRRRALDAQHDSALDTLARALGISPNTARPKS